MIPELHFQIQSSFTSTKVTETCLSVINLLCDLGWLLSFSGP